MYYNKCYSCSNLMQYKSKKAATSALKNKRICKDCHKIDRNNKQESWNRLCPSCSCQINYKRKSDFKKALSLNQICRECSDINKRGTNYGGLTRACPNCGKIISYNNIDSVTRANKLKTECRSCTAKKYGGPSEEALSKAILVNKSRIRSEDEIKRRKENSFLGSEKHRELMIAAGFWSDISGETISNIIKDFKVPPASIYKIIKRMDINSKESILSICKNYKRKCSSLENIFSKQSGFRFYNKKISQDFKYRPDFKLSDSLYLNVDGLYWHSELINNDRWYHFNMRKDYESLGKKILQIREHELYKNSDAIISIINNLNYKNTIEDDILEISSLTTSEGVCFFNKNHFVKPPANSKYIGVKKDNKLYFSMSFSIDDKILYINLFAYKKGYFQEKAVSIAIDKLIKTFNLKKIIYISDLRWDDGQILIKNGFKIQEDLLNWEWTNFKTTCDSNSFYDNMDYRSLCKEEYAKEMGFVKIFGAGKRLLIRDI